MRYLTWLEDLSKVWSHLPENFGPVNAHYLKMLTNRLTFHKKHIKIPGNLEIKDQLLAEITGHEANGYFEFCIELLDLMDDIMSLQSMVFHQLDRANENSMTLTGQCKLYPLVLAVQDSCQLYDYLVKVLFKLHKAIPPDTLGDLRARFLSQYKSAKQFYQTCQGLQYFKGIIQVPTLPDSPPNFLIASEIFKHRKPVAVVDGEEPEEEPDSTPPPVPDKIAPLIQTAPVPAEPVPDSKDIIINQLKTQVEHLRNELEFVKVKAREKISSLNEEIGSLKSQLQMQKEETNMMNSKLADVQNKLSESNQETEELKQSLSVAEENAAAAMALSKAAEQAKTSDERYKKMRELYENLKQEHVTLLRNNAAIKKQTMAEKQAKEEKEQQYKEAYEEVERLKSEQNVLADSMQKSADESSQHMILLEQRIEELGREKAEFEEKLLSSENENDSLKTQVANYQTTNLALEENLKVEKESSQQSASSMGQQLSDVNENLEQAQANAASLDEKNKELSERIEKVESDKNTLETNLATLISERDQAREDQAKTKLELEAKLAEFQELLEKKIKDDLESRQSLAYNSLVVAVDEGVKEVNYTLDFIASEEFITHTCCAESAVEDLSKLDGELSKLSSTFESSNDSLELSHLIHAFSHRLCRTLETCKGACNRAPPEQGDDLAEKCHILGNDSVKHLHTIKQEYRKPEPDKAVLQAELSKVREDAEGMLRVARSLLIKSDDINVDEIGELVEEELNATQKAIQEGAQKVQEMLEKARMRDTGVKLEVNEKILDSVTKLMAEIQQLVRKSKVLQEEIVTSGRGSATAKEFYKKNHRWTEGLVSAAKAVGWGASTLVEKAEIIMEGKGTLNELKVCSNEIAASTAQLVVSSQVKADKESTKLADLKLSAKGVKTATADVVASSNFGEERINEADLMNFNDLSLTQTKRVEMNTQVHILELESKLVKERKKLAEIRKRHYQLAGRVKAGRLEKMKILLKLMSLLRNGDKW
ncbi:Hip1 [Bugula neritina]|uniref:Hip1 n=1 Tax=Bugula neritina TaxID=10212 RepID=A0A7J7KL87_BUGNE|nr:Hip1 [Bugula neritina]